MRRGGPRWVVSAAIVGMCVLAAPAVAWFCLPVPGSEGDGKVRLSARPAGFLSSEYVLRYENRGGSRRSFGGEPTSNGWPAWPAILICGAGRRMSGFVELGKGEQVRRIHTPRPMWDTRQPNGLHRIELSAFTGGFGVKDPYSTTTIWVLSWNGKNYAVK